MCDHDNLSKLQPALYEIDECIREVHDFKIKKRQFLESTGVIRLTEPNGLIITKAVVSGIDTTKDITGFLVILNVQQDCPIDTLVIDTGKLNEYTGADIEFGTRKMIEVHYITDDFTVEEKKVNKIEQSQETKFRVYDREDECKEIPKFESDGVSQVYKINKDRGC